MSLKSLDTVKYDPVTEDLTKILINRSQSHIPNFFRVSIAFHLTRMASMMRCKVHTADRGIIPISGYMINLAPSGKGKGLSTNLIEEHVCNQFRNEYMDVTFPTIAKKNIANLAIKKFNSVGNEATEEDCLEAVTKEFEDAGELPFDYDSGTSPAFKQVRHKCLMAKAGALNFFVDEIGTNLLSNSDLLGTYLESYDLGLIKQKLIKNTIENRRAKEIRGSVPSNMLLFGTPPKLLDGGKTEDEFLSMLETGYSRRCLFGYSLGNVKNKQLTPEEVYDIATSKSDNSYLNKLSAIFKKLATVDNFDLTLNMDKDVNLLLIEYRQQCEALADAMPEHRHIHKAETSHRYFKALKLAGAYAFIDSSDKVYEKHLYAAIKLVEDSGIAFEQMLNRDKPHIKLAKFIASTDTPVTKSDLIEDLPSYRGNELQKKEMMTLAIAYGYKNNIIIKEEITDDISFYSGESLEETNLDEMILSYSGDKTTGYNNQVVKFNQLHKLCTAPKLHWVAHHLLDGYRDAVHVIKGFDLLVLDLDDGTSIDMVKLLLSDYKFFIHTTKRHTDAHNRFRVILPMSHKLKLSPKDYKEFMQNVYAFLPFDVDSQTADIARKWMTHNGKYSYNDGELFDVIPFIPKTTAASKQKQKLNAYTNLNNLERWVIANSDDTGRNNALLRYGFVCVDLNQDLNTVQNSVLALNSKLPKPLPEREVLSTVMLSISKKIIARDSK